MSRHLDPADKSTKADGVVYRKFHKDLELLCYCLMGNHFHLLFYTVGDGKLLPVYMQSVLTAYSMYFNKKYKRVGTLFQGVFRASRISDESYLLHITRYIHLNPKTYKTYFYSSLPYYCGQSPPIWLKPRRIFEMFELDDYMDFVNEYEEQKNVLEQIKHELADS